VVCLCVCVSCSVELRFESNIFEIINLYINAMMNCHILMILFAFFQLPFVSMLDHVLNPRGSIRLCVGANCILGLSKLALLIE